MTNYELKLGSGWVLRWADPWMATPFTPQLLLIQGQNQGPMGGAKMVYPIFRRLKADKMRWFEPGRN